MENIIITTFDINSDYIKRADIIWGPAESVLQGKMKRKTKQTKQNSKTNTTSIGTKKT